MIAIQTTTEINYDSRNPANTGKVRIEVRGVNRDPQAKHYYMHIIDSAIYKYDIQVPIFEQQEVEVPVYDEEGNETGETTTEMQQVQVGTETQQRDGIRMIRENKRYPVSYDKALQLEQAVLSMFPPDPSIQGAELRDYITKYGLFILTTQLEEVPTYNVSSEDWEFVQ
jgi:hypothetical protein